jgi:hypothetical protein
MLRKIILIILALLALSVSGLNHATAENNTPACVQLDTKVSGEMKKYSVHGEANGPVFFSGISCAIQHRNKELCAMEMVSFDTTAMVYDYYSGEEVEIGKAYFWLDKKNNETPIVAFGSKESAEEYGTTTGGGVILDYTGLTDRELR